MFGRFCYCSGTFTSCRKLTVNAIGVHDSGQLHSLYVQAFFLLSCKHESVTVVITELKPCRGSPNTAETPDSANNKRDQSFLR